ncbi:tectonic-3 isoform X2 [Takifugu rubripes]|uniref:tectonic-3 isoform X2 n=1 Tax=Takifugu rubripes TaxID=31033 RepID=UPI001145E2A6|nr:tectonic-3 isoform X2 [Takifugu rubripes]
MWIPCTIMTNEMKFCGCFLIWTLIAICSHLTNATAEPGSNSTVNDTFANVEPDGTPSPTHPFTHPPNTVPLRGGEGQLDPLPTASGREAGYPLDESPSPTTWDNSNEGKGFRSEMPPPTTDGNGEPLRRASPPPADATIEDDHPNFINSTMNESEALAVGREAQSATTLQPGPLSGACLCDLTPDFCDIDCCCDTADCHGANLSTFFTECPQNPLSGVCVEKWLMFRANVDPALITVTDSLICINNEDDGPQFLPALTRLPTLGNSYHFSSPAPMSSTYSRNFYRVNDVIQTYFSNLSVRGLLRQPSPGPLGTICTNQNPAKFLRSVSFSCTRTVTRQSCSTDPNLNAHSYFYNMSLTKIPVVEMKQVSDFLIAVTPQSDWPVPSEHNSSCLNVVKKVEFIIGYTGRGELTYANVNVILADVAPDQLLLQTHSVLFQLEAGTPPPRWPSSAVGLRIGSPVMTLLDGKLLPLTTLRVSQSGKCSSDPNRRSPILFMFNTFTGCTLRLDSDNCSVVRSQIYTILEGLNTSDMVAMNFGSQPEWTRVINKRCPISAEESCESGCVLPKGLSIQVLWARQGPLDLSQNYILGAKYLFQCQKFQCPVSSPLILTTEVTFAETTRYPDPPRNTPQPKWKFPFGFFSQGITELDGHFIMNGSEKVTWSLILFTVMLLTGLEFFT